MRSFLSSLLLLTVVNASSQDAGYFQQEVNYNINVSLNDRLHELSASLKILYINNSPDTLGFIWFHLWPNAYSSNKTALARQIFMMQGKQKLFNDPIKRGFIDSLDFRVNDEKAEWEILADHPDICRVILPEILLPGDSITILTPFHVKLPVGNISRMGFNSGVYQVSQWYPKPAVYDRNGWHQMSYLDQGEYYSEFGSFDVTITIQENYVVAASGELQTQEEIDWLSEVAASWQVYDGSESPDATKTIRYWGETIHDFVWVASKRFRVMQDSVILPSSGRKVKTMVFFTGMQGYLWEKAVGYVNSSILSFSEWIGDYPYSTYSAVQTPIAAGSGMEYPGLAIIGFARDEWYLNQVITHEIAHNWFYSAIGSDERRYPFMDESLATAYELRHMNLHYPGKQLWEMLFRKEKTARSFRIDKLPADRISEIGWLLPARNNLEQPLDLPAPDYSPGNYGDIVYYKGGQGFNYLRVWLGDTAFDNAMREYYKRWTTRHPSPQDFREVFESNTRKDLSWFFDDFLTTTKRYDYRIKKLEGQQLNVKNRGEMVSPVSITGLLGDSVVFRKWVNGFEGTLGITLPPDKITSVRLNEDHLIPELYHADNNSRTSGFFRKADPMIPQLFMPVEVPERRTLMMFPLVNWNSADGFMPGLAVNNGFLLPKRIEYFALPFYSFRNRSLAGKVRIAYNLIPYNSPVRKASVYLEGAKFGATEQQDYRVLRTGLDINFRNREFISEKSHSVYGRFILASDLAMLETDQEAGMLSFWQSGYSVERPSMVNPFSFYAMYETNGGYHKTSVNLNYKYSYTGKNNGLEMRLFAGSMLGAAPEKDFYGFAPSGRSGRELYLYQGEFPDRFSVFPGNFWSREMLLSEGGIVTPVNDSLGYSNWLISASFSTTFPGRAGRIPVKPFVNAVVKDNGNDRFFWEAGFKAGIWGVFEIHVPLVVSENLSFRSGIKDRLRFILSLETFYRVRLHL